jgi:hypothetical protein
MFEDFAYYCKICSVSNSFVTLSSTNGTTKMDYGVVLKLASDAPWKLSKSNKRIMGWEFLNNCLANTGNFCQPFDSCLCPSTLERVVQTWLNSRIINWRN